jgi:hypothetical protein
VTESLCQPVVITCAKEKNYGTRKHHVDVLCGQLEARKLALFVDFRMFIITVFVATNRTRKSGVHTVLVGGAITPMHLEIHCMFAGF